MHALRSQRCCGIWAQQLTCRCSVQVLAFRHHVHPTQFFTRSARPLRAAQSGQETINAPLELVATVEHLQKSLANSGKRAKLEPKKFKSDVGYRVGFIAMCDLGDKEVILELPEDVAITSIDAEKHELVGEVAKECSELVALALWLMAERAKGSESQWTAMLHTLPESTMSPILWDDQERAELLRGSPILQEARQRQAALQAQWSGLSEKFLAPNPARFSPLVFNEAAFVRAFCVVLAHACFLPSAECFALLPLASLMSRTGNENGCDLDYDADRKAVVVAATRPYRCAAATAV